MTAWTSRPWPPSPSASARAAPTAPTAVAPARPVRPRFAAVRLLYLLVDETDPAPERVALRRTQGQQMVPAGWTFQVDSIRIGPEFYEENAVGHLLAGPGILHAVLIACFSDPALAAARAVSRLPVVGPGEASLLLAQLTARTFGVITILDSTV